MRKMGAAVIAFCGLSGAFAIDLGLSGQAFAFAHEPSGSAGSDGDGDHMAGDEDNIDQVTNSGPNRSTPELKDAEREADGYGDDD